MTHEEAVLYLDFVRKTMGILHAHGFCVKTLDEALHCVNAICIENSNLNNMMAEEESALIPNKHLH